MTDIDRIDQRLAAVERVVVDGDVAVDELGELTALTATIDSLEARVEEHERRLGILEASLQSVEGYVGNVESISDDVERQAASAVATVDRLERKLEVLEADLNDVAGGILEFGEATGDLKGEDVDQSDPGESKSDRADPDESKSDRSDPDESKSDRADLDAEDGRRETDGEMTIFEFGVADGESNEESVSNARVVERSTSAVVERSTPKSNAERSRREPDVERSVRKLFEVDSKQRAIVDDGVDRPESSATQSAIDTAVAGRDEQQPTNRSEDTDRQGLLGSIRSRLS